MIRVGEEGVRLSLKKEGGKNGDFASDLKRNSGTHDGKELVKERTRKEE